MLLHLWGHGEGRMEFSKLKTGDTFRYNAATTMQNPIWVVATLYVNALGEVSATFDRPTYYGFETVFSCDSYNTNLELGYIVWEAPVRPPVALDNTPYTQLRNWRTKCLPRVEMSTLENLLEGIAMDLIDCDDPDSASDLQSACDDLDALYGLPDLGLEGVE